MRRGKPQQPLYRPGSGPLRKSNSGIEESESDTNLIITRQNQSKNFSPYDDSRYKSEGSSPRNRVSDIDSVTSKIGDISISTDTPRRQKKPEQELYVPRPVAQSREMNSSHDYDRNSYGQSNGNDKGFDMGNDRFGNRSKRYSTRRRGSENDYNDEWREKSPSMNRQLRQGSEPRGPPNNGGWPRTRDTRSVEPSVMTNRNYSEKIQNKPPSGRRNSTTGVNITNIPPRFRKKLLAENKFNNPTTVEENWDGNSLTFQGSSSISSSNNQNSFPKNSNFHQMNYATLPGGPLVHSSNSSNNQNAIHHSGYHTLPNRPRGRGRLQQEFDVPPGVMYRSLTPDKLVSPCNSRPHTPPPFAKAMVQENLNKPDYLPPQQQHFHRNDAYNNDGGSRNFKNPPEDKYNRRNHYDKRNDDRPHSRNSRHSEERRFNNRDYEHGGRDHDKRRNNDNYNHGRDYNNRRDNNRRDNRRDYGNRRESNIAKRLEVHPNPPVENRNLNNGNVDTPKQGFRQSLEAQLSPVSPEVEQEVQEVPLQPVQIINTQLDWSEEVELHDRLEAEAFSDAMTRSSSLTSLVEISTKSAPPSTTTPPSQKKSKRRNRKKSGQRSGSQQRDNSNTRSRSGSIRQSDTFKVPQEPHRGRGRRASRDRRDSSYERRHNKSKNVSRESSFDRNRRSSTSEHENWREEIIRSRQNSEHEGTSSRISSDRSRNNSEREDFKGVIDMKKAGVIVLPQKQEQLPPPPSHNNPPALGSDQPRYPDSRKSPGQSHQKSLFDPNNPKKPIVVKSQSTRVAIPGFSENSKADPPQMYTTDQFGNIRPKWYDETSDSFKSCHFPDLIRDIKRADSELQYIITSGLLLVNWGTVESLRQFLKEALEYLVCRDLKFAQNDNVEQHLWKILYHNIIEVTRKAITNDPDNKEQYKGFLLYLIDEGCKYFENLLEMLEETYQFKLNNFLGYNNMVPQKGLGYVGLALICAQKLFLFLGDLGRYREQVNESSNYGKCRQWYIKSHEINPKNGKPYNQLAVLAVYARRRLDAVYYYMRSLMSSNPVLSARENLVALFDENRKKYEQGEKKRREERQERARQHMRQKESEEAGCPAGSLRRETWVHPDGGKRVHRTTQNVQEQKDSEEEDLASLSSVEVNKRFVISYLHVHGKLITRIGMESFHEAAMQMLKEFRALLQHSPLPLPCNRFLQLLALNMFAIESTQLKDPQLQSQQGYRSELQEKALVVSFQMFNLILEKCVSMLEEHFAANPGNISSLPQDVQVLLPAIKIWCDWLLGHSTVWNPPPSTQDYKVGAPGDAWSRLATLMNILDQLDQSLVSELADEQWEGYEPVRLPEDCVLCGFTPLLYNEKNPTYAPKELDVELVQFALRLKELLFFGTVFLCGLDPPVLHMELENDFREYVSVVHKNAKRDWDEPPQELVMDDIRNDDLLLESVSGEEDGDEVDSLSVDAPSPEVRDLLCRKVELEKRHRSQELHMQRVKKILSQSVVSVHIEVRPKYLVPDTNCFIDHLDRITTIASSHVYTLMVPIVVLSELEGLARGGRSPMPETRRILNPQHVLKVAEASKKALDFLKSRHQSVKCVTTKGAVLTSTTFTTEDDSTMDSSLKNDDKILTTCLVLCKGHKEATNIEGKPRQIVREVVLLTDDRNLRVKAHARDVPVRELPDFMQWAGLG